MNAAVCKLCGDLIQSTSVHEFRTCRCKCISVDGGEEYRKRCGAMCMVYEVTNDQQYAYLSVLTPHERLNVIINDPAVEMNWRMTCLLLYERIHELEEGKKIEKNDKDKTG